MKSLVPGNNHIEKEFVSFLRERDFPCVAAREAAARQQVECFVATHISCPHDDAAILSFLYGFIDKFRQNNGMYHTAAIIFPIPFDGNEEAFESFFWQRLQSLSSMDARNHEYDARVSSRPNDPNFSFSLGKEAFFVIGMHANSSRPSRRYSCPVFIFNPHEQFQQMKTTGQYDKLKAIVRKRDLAFSGSLNPMLDDFGKTSEAMQYTGKAHDGEWKCPLNIEHASH